MTKHNIKGWMYVPKEFKHVDYIYRHINGDVVDWEIKIYKSPDGYDNRATLQLVPNRYTLAELPMEVATVSFMEAVPMSSIEKELLKKVIGR